MDDPLRDFREWEGQLIGSEIDLEPGFYAPDTPPRLVLHYAGGHVQSSARKDRNGQLHPAVWLKLILKVIGTEKYHIVEGFLDAEIALELGKGLIEAAERAPLDLAAFLQEKR